MKQIIQLLARLLLLLMISLLGITCVAEFKKIKITPNPEKKDFTIETDIEIKTTENGCAVGYKCVLISTGDPCPSGKAFDKNGNALDQGLLPDDHKIVKKVNEQSPPPSGKKWCCYMIGKGGGMQIWAGVTVDTFCFAAGDTFTAVDTLFSVDVGEHFRVVGWLGSIGDTTIPPSYTIDRIFTPIPQIPAITHWGLIILIALILLAGVYLWMRRKPVTA